MSRVMSGDLRRVLVWFGLWARRGTHRPCICTSLEPPKRAVEQDARAPHAHRRRYTPQRDGSLRRYVGVTVTSAHTKGRRLGLKIRGANNYSMHAGRMGGETGGPRAVACKFQQWLREYFARAGDARMERRPGWGGSARDGQLNPRVTREGWPATVSHLGVPAPFSDCRHSVPVHE
jgi:hypothetical protein